MKDKLLTAATTVEDAVLKVVAYTPTESLAQIADPAFFAGLSDRKLMRIATLLARKSYDEGGCPIGAVITDSASRRILGKGHNTLVQNNDPTTHGETAALRDAGRVAMLAGQGPVDFRRCTLYTTLTPCLVCCAQIVHRCQVSRVVIGDVSNAPTSEPVLRTGGIENVVVLEDPMAVSLYREYVKARPELHYLDWGGHKKWDEARHCLEADRRHSNPSDAAQISDGLPAPF